MGKLEGRIALVTGSSRGIGRGIAIAFAVEGAVVIVNATTLEAAERTAEKIRSAGGEALAVEADVSNEGEVKAMVDKTLEKFGRIEILVNNAGIMRFGKLHETPVDEWDSMMRTNAFGPWRLMVQAVPHMRKAGGGSIINLSSIAGIKALAGAGVYCTSKTALQMVSQVMAMETAADNIRVNMILPALVEDTELAYPIFGKENIPDFYNRLRNLHPMGRNGKPKDIADAALFFASDESSWITGVMLNVDGGRHLATNRPVDV